MEVYGRIFRVVEPKRKRLNEATSLLAEKQATLAAAQDKLAKVNELMENLKKQYEDRLAEKARLQHDAEMTAMKLDRAGKLVSGLAGEKEELKNCVSERIPQNSENCKFLENFKVEKKMKISKLKKMKISKLKKKWKF